MNLNIKLNYVTNFKPNTNSLLNLNNIKIQNKKKITCKNFIIFIVLMRYIFKNQKINFFVKPNYSPLYNILRAPYKNKISRHQITISRYFILIVINITLNNNVFRNLNSILFFINSLKNFYSFFETNICFQHRSVIIFNFKLKKFFKFN